MFEESKIAEIMKDAPGLSRDMAERIYTSRLIGADPDWVLHGGGNTSVKLTETDLYGQDREVLYVKGSGVDMAVMTPDDFTPLDLAALQRLRQLDRLSDAEMDNQLRINKLNASAPDPSVEALLHAFLPHKFIDHTHADALLALTNHIDAESLISDVLGPGVGVIGYDKSGLDLAKSAYAAWEQNPEMEALIVLNHGIFTFGEDAQNAFERMAAYIDRAEAWLAAQSADGPEPPTTTADNGTLARIAEIIRGACAGENETDSRQTLLADIRHQEDIIRVSMSPTAEQICRSGVLTPDHAIRTKNRYVYIDHIPAEDDALKTLVAEQVKTFKTEDEDYCLRFQDDNILIQQDATPRVFLVAGAGLFALGRTRKAARIAADIAEHTVLTKFRAGMIDYAPIDEAHVFDMEYWPLQLKKINARSSNLLEGKIALVTGAAGAIGFGIADRLLAAGAAVVISDIDESGLENVRQILSDRYDPDRVAGASFDVTDEKSVQTGMTRACLAFGGLDILVPNAGTAFVSKIEDLDSNKLQSVINVNLIGTFNVIKAAVPIFRRQATGGNIVVISTKNVFDPGAAFGAYSASKAGAHQLARIAALELAELGVRVNMINPDAVFGDEAVPSKLWEMIGPDRMKARGLDPEGLKEYYRQRNLLKKTVTAEHVGNAVVFFAADLTPTTGAALPVDGGVPAAFPR